MTSVTSNLFQLALDASSDAYWITDRDGTVVYCNRAAESFFQSSAERIVGSSDQARFVSPLASRIFAHIQAALMGGNKTCEEWIQSDPESGIPRYFDVSHQLLLDDDGIATGVLGCAHEVTALRSSAVTSTLREEDLAGISSALVDAMAEGVVFQRDDGQILSCNASAVRILSLTADQICGRTSLDPRWQAIHEDGTPFPGEEHPSMVTLRTGMPCKNVIMGLSKPDGSLTWISINSQPMTRPGDARPFGVVCSFSDITARKRSEDELKQTSNLLHWITDGTADAVFVKDRSGKYLFFNEAAGAFVGRRPSEVIGLDDFAIFDLESARRLRDRDLRVMQEAVVRTEEETLTANQSTRTYLASKGPFFDAQNRVAGVWGISRDISDRKRAENALRESEERLRSVLNFSPSMVYLQDLDGRVLFMNRCGANLLDLHPSVIVGKSITEIFPAETASHFLEIDQQILAGLTAVQEETTIEFTTGNATHFLSTHFPLRDMRGRPYAICSILADITVQKQLADQVRQSQKLDAVGRLAGGIAHDFNNLLTVINGYAELLLDALSSTSSHREALMAIREAGQRAATLTSQLLAFSRKAIIEPQVLDINALIDSMANLLRRLIREDIQLNLTYSPTPLRITADTGQLQQVLMNLVVNARDAMPAGGTVTIQTSYESVPCAGTIRFPTLKPGDYACVIVSDNGCGIPDNIRGKIFEPFFTTKEVGKGTGLGLSVVHGIIEQCGGLIDVQSEPGLGTSFSIFLPLTSSPLRPDRIPTPTCSPRGTERILLVEDEDAVRNVIRLALEAHGFQVLAAETPAAAMELANSFTAPIDALVTDLVMPGMNGQYLAEVLRSRFNGLRVLFISGHSDTTPIRDDERLDGFLHKPFTPVELVAHLRDLLDRPVG